MEMTPFDIAISSKELNLLKALIPYFQPDMRRLLSLYIKTEELRKTMAFDFTKLDTDTSEGMFCVLKNYMSPEDGEKMESFTSMMEMFEMLKTMNDLNNEE